MGPGFGATIRRTRCDSTFTSPWACTLFDQLRDGDFGIHVGVVVDALNTKTKELQKFLPIAFEVGEGTEIIGIDLLPDSRHFRLHSGSNSS